MKTSTHFVGACEAPFKVGFVSEAKCHESVFDAGEPNVTGQGNQLMAINK